MIYKKHELSLSLNGNEIVHIARNASGNIVFRESSESKLKKAIDNAIKEQEHRENKKTKSNEPVIEDEIIITEDTEVLSEQTLVPQKRVTRGPDGKFISKSQLDTDENLEKKSFWNKLTS